MPGLMACFATAWRPRRAEEANDQGKLSAAACTEGGATNFLACTNGHTKETKFIRPRQR